MIVYSVVWPQDGQGGVARKASGWWPPKFDGHELASVWQEPIFEVQGLLVDLQPNDAGVKMMSAQMCATLQAAASPVDRIEWLPVSVRREGECHPYAIPHILDEIDVIDRSRSVLNRATGGVIKAHLRAAAIDGHHIFTYSNTTGLIFLFTGDVYERIRDCTGCSFVKVPVT
jgi:hypothetical protein